MTQQLYLHCVLVLVSVYAFLLVGRIQMIRNGHTVLLGRGRFLSPSAKYMVLLKTSHDNNELSISNCYNLRTYETYGTTVRWYLSINFSPGISQVWIDVFWICSLLHIEVVETIWRDSFNHCYDLLVQSSAFVEPRRFQQKSRDGMDSRPAQRRLRRRMNQTMTPTKNAEFRHFPF